MILSTHSEKLERWIGKDQAEIISNSMKDWYGPPIGLGGVPGSVWACKGGDFKGPIKAGQFINAFDFTFERLKRIARDSARRSIMQMNTGFSSLSDVIAEFTTGKGKSLNFYKTGATGVVAVTNSLWGLGSMPAAGANAASAPNGEAPTRSTQGALYFNNPSSPDTTHFLAGNVIASVSGNTLLLYDRIFQVNKTMASTATEAVTGVPSRYQSTTPGAQDSAEGNFLFVEVGGTALAATAHNWTVCQYTDQGGTTGVTLPSLTGNSSAIVRRLDHPVGQWFAPLATNDTGIKNLTQMQCSASVATGVINFVIGHPIAFIPCAFANILVPADGIYGAFNLKRIFDDAALALLEVCKPATSATNYTGIIDICAG